MLFLRAHARGSGGEWLSFRNPFSTLGEFGGPRVGVLPLRFFRIVNYPSLLGYLKTGVSYTVRVSVTTHVVNDL